PRPFRTARVLSFLLGDPYAPRIGNPRGRAARFHSGCEQLPTLPCRPPGCHVRGVQPFSTEQRAHGSGGLTPVGLPDNLPLVVEGEPPPRRLRRYFDL